MRGPNGCRVSRGLTLILLAVVCVALGACAGPIGTSGRPQGRAKPTSLTQRHHHRRPELADARRAAHENGLFDLFAERPEDALAADAQADGGRGGDPNVLFALAELSYPRTQHRLREYSLAAAVYAYAFLFPEGAGVAPGRSIPLRIAADLYNWSLAAAFAFPTDWKIVPQRRHDDRCRSGDSTSRSIRPPCARETAIARWFIPIAELEVCRAGGALSLAGHRRAARGVLPADRRLEARPRHGGAADARCRSRLCSASRRRVALVRGQPLASHAGAAPGLGRQTVSIDGEQVPLENEPSAALALTFTGCAGHGARDARLPRPAHRRH